MKAEAVEIMETCVSCGKRTSLFFEEPDMGGPWCLDCIAEWQRIHSQIWASTEKDEQ